MSELIVVQSKDIVSIFLSLSGAFSFSAIEYLPWHENFGSVELPKESKDII